MKKPKDRRPKSQHGSYLTRLIAEYGEGQMEEKKPIKCEQAIDAVQGCGNPQCLICLPESGRATDFPYVGVSGGVIGATIQEATIDMIRNSFRERFGMDAVYGFDPLTRADLARPNVDAARQRLEQAEAAARGPIKKFLLETEHQVTWHDVVGNEEAHDAMIEAIEFPIKHKELFAHYGKKMTKGILLKGPPGCGKTMLAKAAASVMSQLNGGKKTAIISVAATELQSPYIGKTEEMIRDIFKYARAYKALHGHQLVVFIDEADAILPARQGSGGTRRVAGWEESNVATFLAEMDGMEESGALVILATNRPEAIDTAILRDGRIDRKITVKRPTQQSAKIIFERAFRVAPVDNGVMMGASDPGRRPSLDNRDYLVNLAMDTFFDPTRHLLKIKHETGTDYITMADVVSGAMMVGLVERMKALAFHRDVQARTITGIMDHDVIKAIDMLTDEQREQPDIYALTEFAQRVKSQVLEIDRVKAPEIKYTGTLN